MLILEIALFFVTLFLAYSNGANDNFKGVATLFGSQTTEYTPAIAWATVTTLAGSICSIFLAQTLVRNFSGSGLVPDSVATSSPFHFAVALGAGLTVMLATVTGFPISTTHALTGALTGAGFVAMGTQINLSALGTAFFLPLLVSPFTAIVLGMLAYASLRYFRIALGVEKAWCLCAGKTQTLVPILQPNATQVWQCITTPDITLDTQENCTQRYTGKFLGISSNSIINACHFFSAGVVSFARGLNDTPKIVALLLTVRALSLSGGILAIALGMAAGGLLNARKVAVTMSKKITPLNAGQGLAANVVTGILVIFASRMGVPVSTTHVSVGAIFGVGTVSKSANVQVFSQIVSSWVFTLPIAALFSSFIYWLLML